MKKYFFLLCMLFASFGLFVKAQNSCDQVFIVDVRYDAFRDSILLVEVINNSTDIFSYPGFILYDTNGDTIAQEVVDFFGIGQTQISDMVIFPDAVIPADTFQGTLELWTGFYASLACTFNISELLCPDTPCSTFVFELANFGGALVMADYTYSILDDQGVVQVSQEFTLEDTIQHYADTICLPMGAYTLEVSTEDNPTGGQPFIALYELMSYYWASQVGGPIDQGSTSTTIPFVLYANCSPISNATFESERTVPLTIHWSVEGVWASAQEGQLQDLALYDLAGRQVATRRGPAKALFLPSGDLQGLFIAHGVLDTGERVSEKVFFW